MFWSKPMLKKILVVGGEGFIGSTLLRTQIYELESMDLKSGQDFITEIRWVNNYDTIILLAASMSTTPTGYKYNEAIYEALDAYMVFNPQTQVIFTSSAAVYPDSRQPSSEHTPPEPFNWYGKSKLQGEAYVQQYEHHTILRLSNVYGHGEGNGVIDRYLRGGKIIYGRGNAVRDFVPVNTVVNAIISAIEDPKDWQGITNVSTGQGIKVSSIWKEYGTGTPLYKPSRPSDVRCSILDNTKLKRLQEASFD